MIISSLETASGQKSIVICFLFSQGYGKDRQISEETESFAKVTLTSMTFKCLLKIKHFDTRKCISQ